jgi:hypothetical protein
MIAIFAVSLVTLLTQFFLQIILRTVIAEVVLADEASYIVRPKILTYTVLRNQDFSDVPQKLILQQLNTVSFSLITGLYFARNLTNIWLPSLRHFFGKMM